MLLNLFAKFLLIILLVNMVLICFLLTECITCIYILGFNYHIILSLMYGFSGIEISMSSRAFFKVKFKAMPSGTCVCVSVCVQCVCECVHVCVCRAWAAPVIFINGFHTKFQIFV